MSFKLNDFFTLLSKCTPTPPIELYNAFFGVYGDAGNISKQLRGKLNVPKNLIRKVMLEGNEKIKCRLLKNFPEETFQDFWSNIEKQYNDLVYSTKNSWIKYSIRDTDDTPSKLVDLFLGSLIDTMNTNSFSTSTPPKHIFDFIGNEELDSISDISIMFHSGLHWYRDTNPTGRMNLISKIMQNGITLKILINNSESVQAIFDSNYLNSNYGSYDDIHTSVREWKKQAQKYGFMLKSFEHIFFHSMCIVRYKNGQKGKLYLSHYIYQEGLTTEDHPKAIIYSGTTDYDKYCNEYQFIWGHSQTVYSPKSK